jgi:hypothetical protein
MFLAFIQVVWFDEILCMNLVDCKNSIA